MDELGLGEMEELHTGLMVVGLMVVENFDIGDTVDLINIHAEEQYRNSKGFLVSVEKWVGNCTFITVNNKGKKGIFNVGMSYLSMKIVTCRVVLLEKKMNMFRTKLD
jgi:hypothetical protein